MFEKQAQIKRTIEQVEYSIRIQVSPNLALLDRLPQQSTCLHSPRFNPVGSKGFLPTIKPEL